jgi:hypothetical protein
MEKKDMIKSIFKIRIIVENTISRIKNWGKG